MALTQLDNTTAIIVIDLQKGIVGIPGAHPTSDIVHNASQLVEAFRKKQLPVVLVNVNSRNEARTNVSFSGIQLPPDWAELIHQLNVQESDILISKKSWGAFLNTPLDAELKKRGVTQVVVIGIATSIGVESTARSAYDLGYNVTLISDAMTDRSLESHNHSVDVIFPRLAELGTTDELLKLIEAK